MSIVERIKAYYDNQYKLNEEDEAYLEKLNMVFKCIHNEERQDVARQKINILLGKGNHQRIINHTVAVYGDFFEMNKDVMRIIQEKRHQRLYESALRAEEFAAAERALKAIDQLYHLYSKDSGMRVASTSLPRTRRTSNPEALKGLTGTNE